MAHALDNRNFLSRNSPMGRLGLERSSPSSVSDRRPHLHAGAFSSYQNDETKPPRLTSTTNHHYIRRADLSPEYAVNAIKTNTTYSNTTQLYITQPFYQNDSSPPPPPPRHPLQPPAIPPRHSLMPRQKNSVHIPDFNSSQSPKTIYRSPVPSNDLDQPSVNPADEVMTEEGYFGTTFLFFEHEKHARGLP